MERLVRAMEPGECGAVFSLAVLANQVQERLAILPYVRGVDGMAMAGLVLRYYANLDKNLRRRVPLRMVFVPAAKDETLTGKA